MDIDSKKNDSHVTPSIANLDPKAEESAGMDLILPRLIVVGFYVGIVIYKKEQTKMSDSKILLTYKDDDKRILLKEIDFKMENQNRTTMIDSERERLFRANRGKQRITNYIKVLNSTLAVELKLDDFINLKDSDKINSNFFEQFKSHKKLINKKFSVSVKDLFEEELKQVYEFFGNVNVYLLGRESEYCGALLLPFKLVIPHYEKLITYDEDSLNLLSEDMTSGLMIDYFDELDESNVRSDCYELIAW